MSDNITDYRPPLVYALVRAAAHRQGITSGNVFAKTNEDAPVKARAEVMRELRRRKWSLPKIAKVFGLHHSTVCYHLGMRKHSRPWNESTEITYPDLSGEWAI